jgi:hypothetical protein
MSRQRNPKNAITFVPIHSIDEQTKIDTLNNVNLIPEVSDSYG